MILGITGTNGAGKGTVVDYLVKEKGFKHFSASGLIIEEITKRKMPVNRDMMIAVANDLRTKFGAGFIVEELLRRVEKCQKEVIIESIRTLGEVEKLKNIGGILLAVDAEQRLRYERILFRGGNKDKVSFEEFVRQEKGEMESGDPSKQNLLTCKKAADYLIENNGMINELNQKLDELLVKINGNDE